MVEELEGLCFQSPSVGVVTSDLMFLSWNQMSDVFCFFLENQMYHKLIGENLMVLMKIAYYVMMYSSQVACGKLCKKTQN